MGSAVGVAALVDTSSLVRAVVAGATPLVALLVLLLTTGGGVVPLVVDVTPPEADTVSGEATAMVFGGAGDGDTDNRVRCFSSASPATSVWGVVAVESESRIFGVSSLHLPDATAALAAGSELFVSDCGLALRRDEFSGELSG